MTTNNTAPRKHHPEPVWPSLAAVLSMVAAGLALYLVTQTPPSGPARILAVCLAAGWVAMIVHAVGYFATRRAR